MGQMKKGDTPVLHLYSVRSRTHPVFIYPFLCLPESTIYSLMSTSSQATRFEKSVRNMELLKFKKFPRKHLPVLVFSVIYYLALSLLDTSTEAYAIQCHRVMMVINAGTDNSRRCLV